VSDFFTHDEKQSSCWKRLRQHLEDELKALMLKNSSPRLCHDETQLLRGEIRRINKILALDTVQATQEPGNIPHYD